MGWRPFIQGLGGMEVASIPMQILHHQPRILQFPSILHYPDLVQTPQVRGLSSTSPPTTSDTSCKSWVPRLLPLQSDNNLGAP